MQNIAEANNKFEKFLMPIFTKLSVDNRIISNYRMLLNKEITNENIHEIRKRITLYSENLLDIIAYNLHKSEENPDNFFNFVNRRNIIKEFDMRKIEILLPKHCEIILKNIKNNACNDDELAELNDLEAQIFAFIRLGKDCDIYNKNNNNKKCVTKNYNFNGLINNPINNNNQKNLFEDNSINNYNNFNINYISNNTSIINNTNNYSLSNNFKNPFDCKNINEFGNSDNNFKSSTGFFSRVESESNCYNLYKNNIDKIDEFSSAKKFDSPISANIQVKKHSEIKEEKSQISLKKPNESKNILFEVVQGNKTCVIHGKENISSINIEKICNKELRKNKKNLITNANETLNHFLEEKLQDKAQKKNISSININSISSAINQDEITLNSNIYNIYQQEDYHKTACEVESYLNSDFIEISSSANTNYYSNLNTFVDQTKTGVNLKNMIQPMNENIQDFVMLIENQKEFEVFNPLADIFKHNKEDLNNNINHPLENSKSKITRKKLNTAHETCKIQKKDSDINSNQQFANIDIFFEKNKDNNDSTGGDFDRDINSIDDFSHLSSEIDNIKKQKSKKNKKNKQLEEQILKDPNSNFNYYSRQYIPKANKKSEKFKNMIPFLREFNPKFLKKENIDKKILRKFRNFVKSFMENDLSAKIYSRIGCKDDLQKAIAVEYEKFKDLVFLKKFYKQNLLPPMSYSDDSNNITIEFKSFNTNYMLWLFSQEGIGEIYKLFSNNLGNEILNDFVQSYILDIVNKKGEVGIIQTLKDYIFSIEKIYTTSKCKNNTKKKPINFPSTVENPIVNINQNEYSLLNSDLIDNPNNLVKTNQNKHCPQRKIVLDYEIVYQKNRSNTMTCEDIFDKCIDDLEIKNQSMILEFYNSKKEEKNKQLAKMLTGRDSNQTFKILNIENNDEINFNTDKKMIGKIVNEDQMYFEGFNNQQLGNLNYFY
jgi:hypothetical protein